MLVKRAVFAILCVVVLAACGAQPTPETVIQTVKETVEVPVEQTVVVPVEQTVVVPVEQTVIVPETKLQLSFAGHEYWNMTFGPADPPLTVMRNAAAAAFPGTEIQLIMQPLDGNKYHDNLATYFVAKDATVDYMYAAGYWMTEFGAAGWLVPLQDKLDPAVLAKYDQASLDTFTYKGDLLGIGPVWGGIGGLYYRKDLLDAAGIAAPETYDDLIAACDAILPNNPGMGCWDWPAMRNQVLVNRWSEYLYGFGGTYKDANDKCSMNSPEGVAALEFMISLFEDGYTPQEALSWKEEDSNIRFVSGQTLFYSGRQDLLFWIDDPARSQIAGKWGFIVNPAQPGGRHSGFTEFWAFSISATSDNIEETVKLLNVLADTPVMVDINLGWGPIQGNQEVYANAKVLENNKYLPLIQEIAKSALAPLPSPNFGEVVDLLQAEVHSALSGTKTAQQALDDACAAIDVIDAE